MITGHIVVMGSSIIGNAILATTYFKGRNMKNNVYSCIMNMAHADFLMTFRVHAADDEPRNYVLVTSTKCISPSNITDTDHSGSREVKHMMATDL